MLLSVLTSLAARGSVQANNTTDVCVNGRLNVTPDSIRVVVGVTCILSMIGALLIIFSYILIRDIRTKAREILVNLSLMDFMAAAANFFGVVTNFSQSENHSVEGYVCQIQASFAMYGTLSSVLWTICVAVYVFFRIMLENSKVAQRSVYGFYVICYGLPLIMTLWFSLTEKLGGSGGDGDTYGGSGWCSLKINGKHGADTFNVVIGNDIWIYLTIILVPLIFISLHFYLRYQVKAGKTILTQNLSSAVQSVERKLMLIPIIFILLRIWSLLLVIIKVEMDIPLGCIAILFFLHIAGIGDSGQGFANAILFVLFTPRVRRYFFRLCIGCEPCRRPRGDPLFIKKAQYGSVPSDPDTDYSAATVSEASAMNEQDIKSLLVNAS